MRNEPAPATTIDDYIAAFPAAVRSRLEALRRTIRAAAPGAVEAISYRIPAFKHGGGALIYFAGHKTHVGLYPVAAHGTELAAQLAPYASGKATLKFPLDRPLPLALVARVVRAKLQPAAAPAPRAKPRAITAGPIEARFSAALERSPAPNGWTYVVWPQSVEFFGTKGLVKVEAVVDGVLLTTAFMAMGDGRHMLPIKAAVRRAIGKAAGDRVQVELRARIG